MLRFQSTPSVGRATFIYSASSKYIPTFQSTPSVGRATAWVWDLGTSSSFQSTPSVGRATKAFQKEYGIGEISIHALRGEGDKLVLATVDVKDDFNPRPPWGGRPSSVNRSGLCLSFQSTPSVGRATKMVQQAFDYFDISIHALRGEGDQARALKVSKQFLFQSTPSVGRATLRPSLPFIENKISIHALRGEGDEYNGGISEKTK